MVFGHSGCEKGRMSCASAIDFGTSNPRRNLPSAIGRKRGESNFVAAFQRGFTAARAGTGVGGRQFELAGYGIADFVWMEFGRQTTHGRHESVLTAFEMKLKDWRRALMQAYRYSYFADQAVVVLPNEVADRAERHLPTFQHMGVGLWSYDPKTEVIGKRYTPSATQARHPTARAQAIERISRKSDFRKIRK